jgi:hypothetical protein
MGEVMNFWDILKTSGHGGQRRKEIVEYIKNSESGYVCVNRKWQPHTKYNKDIKRLLRMKVLVLNRMIGSSNGRCNQTILKLR